MTKIGGKGVNRPVDSGPITAENYYSRARAFVRSKGLLPNDDGSHPGGFVIRALVGERGHWRTKEPATEPQWIAWLAYFERVIGLPTTFLRSYGLAAVPCEWPEDFDAQAPASNRSARLLPRGDLAAEREWDCTNPRRRVDALFDELVRHLAETSPTVKPKRAPFTTPPEELVQAFDADGPVALSSEALARLSGQRRAAE